MIDYFIVCHRQEEILINSEKFKQLPGHRFLFVGDKKCDLIKNYKNVIVCRDLKDNIEEYKNLLSFTAWYAVSNNKLYNNSHVCFLEYDVELSKDFHQKNQNALEEKANICAYFQSQVDELQFKKSTPWLDIFTRENFDLDLNKFIEEHYQNDFWYPTTNFLVDIDFLINYNKWFYDNACVFKNDSLGSYMHERMINIYCAMNSKEIYFIHDTLNHKKSCSHEKLDVFESCKKANVDEYYEEKLREAAWKVTIDADFDENFYYKNYPDLRNWYKDFDYSLRQKMFHHYFLYGKLEGRLKKSKFRKKL